LKTKKKKDVEDLRQAVPGEVVVSWTDSSRSVAEGNGLEEAEFGREANKEKGRRRLATSSSG